MEVKVEVEVLARMFDELVMATSHISVDSGHY